MAKRQFEIQGSTLRIGGVDLQAGTTGVVIPGVTQATSYRVEEVEDTGDQTHQFTPDSEVVVIDIALYNAIVEEGDVTHFADYTAETDDEGYIDEIKVNGQGTYNGAESSVAAASDMKAYIGSGSASDRPLVEQDWISIPFRPKMRAGDIETIGGGGADLGNFNLGDNTVFNTETDNYINFNGQGQGFLAIGSNDDKDIKISSDGGDTNFTFNSTSGGSLTFPNGTIQTTAYTGGGSSSSNLGTFTTLPDFLDFVYGTNMRAGQNENGIFFSGDAGGEGTGDYSYPIRTNFGISGGTKVTVTLDMVVNDGCSDFGICVFEEGTQPLWAWGVNNTRIAAQYNCENPEIGGLTDSNAPESYELPGNDTYRVRFTYDPNNTPNVKLETMDTNDTVLDTLTYNETLNTGNSYRIGFAADQDDNKLRTYIKNLTIEIDGGGTYANSLTLGGSLPTASTTVLGGVKIDGTTITINNGVISAVTGGQQYGYLNQFQKDGERVNMEAVALDSDGNSYVSYSYYSNAYNGNYGGIIKLSSTGSVVWTFDIASSNSNAQYSRIRSLEYVDIPAAGAQFLVAIGDYYDTDISKERGFMWLINPEDGSTGTQFDVETGTEYGIELRDAVFNSDPSSQPFALLVGQTYNESIEKTFTPLAGSTTDKLFVSWSDFNTSSVQPGDYLYYYVGGSYQVRFNVFDTVASLDGTGDGLYLQVSYNQDGTYNILRANGWSGAIYSWGNPASVRVLGSNLGGVDSTNDLTFDLDPNALNNNSNNVAGWASNIQGTSISDVYGQAWGSKDWSTEIGNALTFNYPLNNQAYIARLGFNSWAKSVGGGEYEQLNSVVVDSSGNSYAVGYYWKNSKGSVVLKFNITGDQQWAVHIDPASQTGNEGLSVDLLSDGNLITVADEGIVTKLNSSDGSIIWQVRVDPNDDISWDGNFKGTATPDGNYIFTNYEDNDYTMYVMCVSGTDGSEIWSKRITRTWGGNNGEIYPEDDFDAQYIDCNATSVTIAANTYLNINGNSTYHGLVINFPISGENTDGSYDQYLIESVSPGWETFTTTSTSVSPNIISSPITTLSAGPNGSSTSFTMTETAIGEGAGPDLGDITFSGSKISSPAPQNGDFPLGVITLAPGDGTDTAFVNNGQFVNIYPTTNYDQPHIHIDAGYGNQTKGDLMLGPDDYHIDINHNGSIYIKTNNQNYTWTFDNSGNLTLPYGGDIRDGSGNSVLISSIAEPRFDVYSNTMNIGTLPNRRYAVDTTNTPTSIYLPSNPQTGDTFFVADAGGAFATNNLTIDRNNMTINGATNNIVLNTNGDSIGMFWNGNTWRLYE